MLKVQKQKCICEITLKNVENIFLKYYTIFGDISLKLLKILVFLQRFYFAVDLFIQKQWFWKYKQANTIYDRH